MRDPRLATLGSVALVALGLGAVLAPRASSRGYGIAVDDAAGAAFVRAAGVRDAVLGAVILWQIARAEDRAAAIALRVSSAVAVADAATVLFGRASVKNRALVHLSGIPALLGAANALDA